MNTKNKESTYKELLEIDEAAAIKYFKKSIIKTEQQKALEELFYWSPEKNVADFKIADIACGGGTLSYHLKSNLPNAEFTLLDFNKDAIKAAKEINPESRFEFHQADMFNSGFKDNSFDYCFSWQTLGWIEHKEAPKMLDEMLRITRKGGKLYLSSLFNTDFNTDIITKIFDYTRPSGQAGMSSNYNTYCYETIEKWIGNEVESFKIHPFSPKIDLGQPNKGLGTFTKRTEEGTRLQISGGMLLNWGILEITK